MAGEIVPTDSRPVRAQVRVSPGRGATATRRRTVRRVLSAVIVVGLLVVALPLTRSAARAGTTSPVLNVTPISSTSLRLTWTPATGATSYVIGRASSAAGPFSRVGSSSTTAYTDGSLKPATTYFYVVQAGASPLLAGGLTATAATTMLPTPGG